MKNKGWIKLYRQIQESALWDDGKPFDNAHAWIDLLLCVNHANRKKLIGTEIETIKRGSMFTSDNFLANRWHWSRERVRRFLTTIERDNMVTIKRTSYGTWINVENYAHFQDGRTTNETGNETSDETTNETSDETQYKNVKNVKSSEERTRERTNRFNNSSDRKMNMRDLERLLIETQ